MIERFVIVLFVESGLYNLVICINGRFGMFGVMVIFVDFGGGLSDGSADHSDNVAVE